MLLTAICLLALVNCLFQLSLFLPSRAATPVTATPYTGPRYSPHGREIGTVYSLPRRVI